MSDRYATANLLLQSNSRAGIRLWLAEYGATSRTDIVKALEKRLEIFATDRDEVLARARESATQFINRPRPWLGRTILEAHP
ncbi:hypothetical protein IZ6_25330 [Terrihabitans soli]|uniref:Uncharacterized protein n=1 Tax=Terrihabitans soli TaxID=708113 RepID=A0A6S6QYW7_9HYPH|nr:hypothetical protein [Terrihabitans soli]BCJ91798.1 hypothetical protein IZ6_25330 [Terrihabitans soli]